MDDDLSNVKGVYDHLADIQLVDCREQNEWDAGRVDGAVHIPLNTLMAGGGPALDPSKPVAVRRTTSWAGWRLGSPPGFPSKRPTAQPAASPEGDLHRR